MQPVVTHGLPIPMTNEHVPVAVTLGNPNPSAVVSVNVIQQPVIHGPTQDSAPNQDLIIHSLGPTHQHFQTAHVAPMPLVHTERGVIQNRPSVALPPAHLISLEQPAGMNIGMAMSQPTVNSNADSTRMWVQSDNGPGPSNRRQLIAHSDSSGSVSSSPRDSLSPMFYQDSDTLDTPPMMESPQVIFQGISSQHDSSSSSNGSPLRTLATAALGLVDSPTNEAGGPMTSNLSDRPLRLPVLINISDSEMGSNTSSVIDLTSSPSAHITHSTPSASMSPGASGSGAPPMLVPVIHEREVNSRRTLTFDQDNAQRRYAEPSLAIHLEVS